MTISSTTNLAPFLNPFVGDSGQGGQEGLVPAPSAGDSAAGKFLAAGGGWAVPSGIGGGVTTVGPFDSQVPQANALFIDGVTLYAQSASPTVPGDVNISTQTFGGAKKFNDQVSFLQDTNFFLLGSTNPITVTSATRTATRIFTFPDANSNPVIPTTATANQWLTNITAGGVQTKAQPDFSNLSGTVNLATQVSGILLGANGGTGVANTGLTINLASGGSGKVLVSDLSGNASWDDFSSLGITSATGTASQVLVNSGIGPVTGAVTFSLASTVAITGLNLSGLTASRAVVTDGSKNLASLVYTTSSSASSLVQRDINQNTYANSFINKLTNVTSAAGTTTLTVASARYQNLTGSTTQTFQLPDATTLTTGTRFDFDNNSTGLLTIKDAASTTLFTIPAGGQAFVLVLTNATVAGTWDYHFTLPTNVSWGTSALTMPGTAVFGGSTLVSNSQTTITQSSTNYGYALAINGTVSTANSSIGINIGRTVTSTSTAGLYGMVIDDTFRGSSGGSLTINTIQQLFVRGTINVAAGSITVSNVYGILVDIQQVSGITATANYGVYIKTPSTGHGGTTTALYVDDLSVGFAGITTPTNGMVINGISGFGTSSPTSSNQITVSPVSSSILRGVVVSGSFSGATQVGFAVSATFTNAASFGQAFLSTPIFAAASATTITSASCYYASPFFTGNAGTITRAAGFLYDGGGSLVGTVTNHYGIYIETPTAGTNKYSGYFAGAVGIGDPTPGTKLSIVGNLNVGFVAGTTAPTNGMIVAGKCVFGGNTAPAGGSSTLVTISHPTNPELIFAATSAATDTKYWAFATNSGATNNTFYGYAWNDALSANSLWLEVQRNTTSQTIQYIRFRNGKTMFGSASDPINTVDIAGGLAIGLYAGVASAPTNGLIVSGNVLFGSSSLNPDIFFAVAGSITDSNPVYGQTIVTNLTETGNNSGTCGLYIGGTHTINGTGTNAATFLQIAPTVVGTTTANYSGLVIYGATGSGTINIAQSAVIYAPAVGSTKVALAVENISVGNLYFTTAPPTNGILTAAFKMPTGAALDYVLTSDASGNASWAVSGSRAGELNLKLSAVKTSNYTALSTDAAIRVNTVSGVVTITLPLASSTVAGHCFIILDVGGACSINNILITPNVADTLNGVITSFNMTTDYQGTIVISNGVNGYTTLSRT